MPFAQSFYYHDRPVDNDSTVTESTLSEDMPTAIEFEMPPVVQKPALPIFSCYIQPGMATPAYNTLAPPAEPATEPEVAAPAASAPATGPKVTFNVPSAKESSQEPPSHYSWPEEMPKEEYQTSKKYKYKESTYMAFKNDVSLVHNRGSQHMTEKAPVPVKSTGSRLVKSIKISEPPVAQSKPYQEYSAVEGDAFKPVITAASEYQLGQLNDLVSYIDIKQ